MAEPSTPLLPKGPQQTSTNHRSLGFSEQLEVGLLAGNGNFSTGIFKMKIPICNGKYTLKHEFCMHKIILMENGPIRTNYLNINTIFVLGGRIFVHLLKILCDIHNILILHFKNV